MIVRSSLKAYCIWGGGGEFRSSFSHFFTRFLMSQSRVLIVHAPVEGLGSTQIGIRVLGIGIRVLGIGIRVGGVCT